MADSKLAGLYVEFTQRGFGEVEAANKAIGAGLDDVRTRMAALDAMSKALASGGLNDLIAADVRLNAEARKFEAAVNWTRQVAQYGQVGARVLWLRGQMAGLAQMAQRAAQNVAAIGTGLAGGLLGGLGGLVGMAAAISQGTVEGDRLAQAMTYLKRVLADELAPYVRMLTQGVIELANWWRGLDSTTKQNVATWIAVAAGVGAVLAVLPAVVAGVSAIAAGFGLLFTAITSPWVAIPIILTGVAAGFAALYSYVTGGAGEMNEALTKGNKSWVDYVIDGITFVGTQFIKFFNWLSAAWGKAVDWLAEKIVEFGRTVGYYTDEEAAAILKTLRSMPATAGPQLSVEKWKQTMEGFKGWVKKNFDLGNLFPGLDAILDRMKKAGQGGGFAIKFDVQLESLQGTFDRLQKAFAAQSGANWLEQQVQLLNAIQDQVQKGVAGVMGIKDFVPALR